MLANIIVSALALAAACVNAQDNAPAQVSGNPIVNRFLCPLTDKSDFPLESFNYAYTAKTYFCSYPSFAGENPLNFYCLYNQKTGALAQDSNVGLCKPQGFLGPTPSRKRSLPQHPQVEERDMSDSMKTMRSVKRHGQKARIGENKVAKK